ncbi:DUF1654 domain-containing protein [Pseudomonas citronellolis]|uniref:DUF1654 domain-containing protein n=1 Tax=Pseudomonas citronellolis TaxID=53408 RepID=UPI0023E3ED85|nr:DUF1654 domain-containing protein [Pseudomonas citronellolis]MDF3936684.1 DUF1654 domain-containing protein [Pseudomonas citronellolis]
MARKSQSVPVTTPYEILARRIQRQMQSPRVQLERRAVIERLPEESEDAWRQLLDDLESESTLTIVKLPDGTIELTWPHHSADW